MVEASQCQPFSIDDGSQKWCGPFALCRGESVTIDGCDCTGDELLTLTSVQSEMAVSYSNDGCGGGSLCSKFTYADPYNTGCQTYKIRQSCGDGTTTCGGSVSYTVFPSVTSYVQYFEDSSCEDQFDSSGGLTNGFDCSAVGDSGLYAKVICEGSSADSLWTATIYPTSQCTGNYMEKIQDKSACDCNTISAYGHSAYSMRVNCAGAAPSCGDGGSGNPSTVAIIILVAGGLAILAVLFLVGIYCRGWLKCRRKDPIIAEAEPLPDPSAPLLPVPAYTDPYYIR